MNIRTYLIAVGTIWMTSEILLVFFRRSGADSTSHDSGSIVWLNAVIYGSIALAIFIGFTSIGRFRGLESLLAWAGLFFILLGLAIRWTAILTLRRFFTVNVAIQQDHRIVQTGLYRIVRHPSYSGTILSFFGLGLAQSNWIALLLLVIPILFAFIKRIELEEDALVQKFGSQYDDYRRSTWRLIPWIY